ncbi:MAG: methionine aminotransferase [Steroidobacteraceae bacterium]
MSVRSKLPDVGTTVFTVMSRRAAETGAINLGQGYPDYPIDPRLTELVTQAMEQGHNQYAPMAGLAALREQIARKLQRCYAVAVDPETEITVTVGATEALFSSIQALVGAGDEVIIFDPAYDSYDPAVRLAGARCVHLPLAPPLFRPDWERVRAAFTARTRLIIINSPHNPACSCLSQTDLDELAALLRGSACLVLADEVYEHMVFDGAAHATVLGHAELRARSVAVYSFGKTLHSTGLRIGYAVAPPALSSELRKVHQFNTFTIASAPQHAVAEYLRERPECGADLPQFFQAKRDRLMTLLAGQGMRVLHSAGSYFLLLDYTELDARADVELAGALIAEAGVATIPLSVFYREPPPLSLLRLCFAKREQTLVEGARRLCAWAHR